MGRKATIELPETISLPIQVFFFWLVLILSLRDDLDPTIWPEELIPLG
jgi:hypothetical protein